MTEYRAEARQAAADYIRAKLPSATIKGISSQMYKYNQLGVDVDIDLPNSDGVIVPMIVQKFFPENGKPYWRVILLHSSEEQRLGKLIDDAKLEELNHLHPHSTIASAEARPLRMY